MANVTTITLAAQEAVVEKLSLAASNIAGISAGVILVASSAVAQANTEVELETVTPDLHLSDFTVDLRETDIAALIVAGASGDSRYWTSSDVGVLTEGELLLGNSNVAIDRIQWQVSNNRIRIRESSSAFNLESHLGSDNSTSEWTLYIQTQNNDGSFHTISSNQIGAATANRVDFRFASGELNNIGSGERFIIAIGKPSAPISVEATIPGAAGSLSSTITKIAAPAPTQIELDDFDTTGLDVDVLALLIASDDRNWYATSERSGSDTPGDGNDLDLGDGDAPITRIRRESNTRVLLNNNHSLSLSTHFGSSNTESEWTLYLQVFGKDAISSNQLANTGGGFANFTFDDPDGVITDIEEGTRFIIAVAQAAAVEIVDKPVEATLSGTGGALSAAITKTSPGTESVNVTLASIGGVLSSTITKIAAPVVTPQLELDDFDDTGLDVDATALITASGGTTWYADSNRSGNDSVD